jgi:hypothetical protein
MSGLALVVIGLCVMLWHYLPRAKDLTIIGFYVGLVMVVFVTLVAFNGFTDSHARLVLGAVLLAAGYYGIIELLRYHDSRTRNGRRLVNRKITIVDRVDRVLDKFLS